jgi:hypothetical protein
MHLSFFVSYRCIDMFLTNRPSSGVLYGAHKMYIYYHFISYIQPLEEDITPVTASVYCDFAFYMQLFFKELYSRYRYTIWIVL